MTARFIRCDRFIQKLDRIVMGSEETRELEVTTLDPSYEYRCEVLQYVLESRFFRITIFRQKNHSK